MKAMGKGVIHKNMINKYIKLKGLKENNLLWKTTYILSIGIILILIVALKKLGYISIITYSMFIPVLIHSAITDIKEKKIPIINLIIIFIMSLATGVLFECNNLIRKIIISIVIFMVLTLLSFLTKGGFGMGDVYIISSLSIFLGINNTILMLFCSLLICSITGICFLVIKLYNRKTALPFTPFLILGYLMVMGISK